MSDQDSSAFNVVDRRTGSRDAQDEPPETGKQPDSIPESAQAPVEDSTASQPDSNDDDAAGALPDPGFLLSMATVQMNARSLIQALIPIFDGYAWRSMGFIADPATGETGKDMPSAQLAIDTVQYLLSKVEAQLADTERRDIQRRLSDLRMNYLAKLREQ